MFECENICPLDCDCVAYGYVNQDGSGSEIWKSGAKVSSLGGGPQRIYGYEKGGLPVWVQVMGASYGCKLLSV